MTTSCIIKFDDQREVQARTTSAKGQRDNYWNAIRILKRNAVHVNQDLRGANLGVCRCLSMLAVGSINMIAIQELQVVRHTQVQLQEHSQATVTLTDKTPHKKYRTNVVWIDRTANHTSQTLVWSRHNGQNTHIGVGMILCLKRGRHGRETTRRWSDVRTLQTLPFLRCFHRLAMCRDRNVW